MSLNEKEIIGKLERLRRLIKEKGSMVIAFSGGVDSSLIAKVAYDELGKNVTAVTIDSDTFSKRELEISKKIAREIGIDHKIFKLSELENEDFVKNPVDRCYFCKKEEITVMKRVAARLGFKHIAFGVNISDFSEHRPGIKALREEGFFEPLVEAGIAKNQIAALAKAVGLSNYNLPSTTCLASRVPYGQPITAGKLQQIEEAESFFYSLGYTQSRVRHYGDLARIEVDEHEIENIIKDRKAITAKLKEIGFSYITLDLEGYRSGSMDEIL
jgi:uncharacterized protein